MRSAIGEGKRDNLFKKVREEETQGKGREGVKERERNRKRNYTTG